MLVFWFQILILGSTAETKGVSRTTKSWYISLCQWIPTCSSLMNFFCGKYLFSTALDHLFDNPRMINRKYICREDEAINVWNVELLEWITLWESATKLVGWKDEYLSSFYTSTTTCIKIFDIDIVQSNLVFWLWILILGSTVEKKVLEPRNLHIFPCVCECSLVHLTGIFFMMSTSLREVLCSY